MNRTRNAPVHSIARKWSGRVYSAARSLSALLLPLALIGATPVQPGGHFPVASVLTLPNGVIVTAQVSNDAPIASAQIFLPAGLAQQSSQTAGIAAVTASIVLRSPADNGMSLADAAAAAGGSLDYEIDPETTRFEIESRASELPRLLRALARAVAKPDLSQFAPARDEVQSAAGDDEKNPARVAYAMVRQVRYRGTGFAYPQAGRSSALARLTSDDVTRFASLYMHGPGTVVALTGALAQSDIDAAGAAFKPWPASAAPVAAAPAPENRQNQIIAHREVSGPWLALGFAAPSQFSQDFPAMLVIEALLGRGGSTRALAFGTSNQAPADDYAGAYYQYDANPGTLVIFLNGGAGEIENAMRQAEQGIARLRSKSLPSDLVARARKLALGEYYLSVTSLSDAAWMLGRSARSPEGVAFENVLAARIAAVSPADILRVAKRYLGSETIAVVLPTTNPSPAPAR
jgi:zinc protease